MRPVWYQADRCPRRTDPCLRRSGDLRARAGRPTQTDVGQHSPSKLRGTVTPAYAIRRQRYCLYNLSIASTAAEIARNRFDDVLSGRVRIVSKQRVRPEDHGRSAVAALQTVCFAEGILQRRQLAGAGGDPFDRRNWRSFGLRCKHQARAHGDSVKQDGTGAANAVLATGMRALKTEMFAQAIEQRSARFNLECVFSAIDGEINSHRVSFR